MCQVKKTNKYFLIEVYKQLEKYRFAVNAFLLLPQGTSTHYQAVVSGQPMV